MNNDRKKLIKNTVRDAIEVLLKEALEAQENPKRAKRYVEMLWALVKKHKVRLTQKQKSFFCRKCLELWIPDKTVKVVFDQKQNVFRLACIVCGYKRTIKQG